MNNQKKLKKYTNSFINALSPYLKKEFRVSATIHPAFGEGAIIEFEIYEGKNSTITFIGTVPTNKDRLCERSEPQSYPVVGQARCICIFCI